MENNEIQRSIRFLTINFDIVEDKPWRRCTYLDTKRTEIEKFDTFSFFVYTVECRLWSTRTWHSYVPSSILSAESILSRQLFGYWKSTEYRQSPE